MVGGEYELSTEKALFSRAEKNFGRYLAIFLMLSTTIALMSGFLSVSDGVQDAFYQDREKSNIEDGLLTSKEALSDEVV